MSEQGRGLTTEAPEFELVAWERPEPSQTHIRQPGQQTTACNFPVGPDAKDAWGLDWCPDCYQLVMEGSVRLHTRPRKVPKASAAS